MKTFTPTASELTAYKAQWSFFEDDAEAIKEWRRDKAAELKAKFGEMAKRDRNHFQYMVSSAHENAAETMRENGLAQAGDKSGDCEYWDMAVRTLDAILDSPESYGFDSEGNEIQ